MPQNDPKEQPRRRKTKTGCRTCKKRKIKCDEGRPACRCCASTGRVCEGYGIWGGGGTRYEHPSFHSTGAKVTMPQLVTELRQPRKMWIQRAPSNALIGRATTEEQSYFGFFQHHTAAMLPAFLGRNFQSSILLQTSATEPAILHAMVALGACHKRKEMNNLSRAKLEVLVDKQDEFVLQQHCKAFKYLRPGASSNRATSVRTVLVACVIFVYTEFLRGNYGTGYLHLQSGLKLVEGFRNDRAPREKTVPNEQRYFSPCFGASDGVLILAFERLQLLVAHASRYAPRHCQPPAYILSDLPTLRYKSSHEARFFLHEIIRGIKFMTKEFSQNKEHHDTWPNDYRQVLNLHHKFSQGAFDMWLHMFETTFAEARQRGDEDEIQGYKILRVYSTMTSVVVATCISVHKQMVFDEHIPSFLAILADCTGLVNAGRGLEQLGRLEGPVDQAARTIPDLGWVSPLYYTAIKCRNRQIRMRAISLLRLMYKRSGCRDFLNLALIAEEVEALENIESLAVGYESVPDPSNLDQSIPLPEERRFEKIDATVSSHDPGIIELICKRRLHSGWSIVRRMYESSKEGWVDMSGDDLYRLHAVHQKKNMFEGSSY